MLHNRYPGPKAFTDADQPSFFGRNEDIDNLFRMILLKKVTVLFGKSGTGKSSLLNAGILPKFTSRGDHEIKSIRFLNYSNELATAGGGEPYLRKSIKAYFALPSGAETFLDKIEGKHDSLLLHFKKLQLLHREKSYIMVLDQFEEIGSYPRNEVEEFLSELNELLNFQIPLDFEKALNQALGENENLLSDDEMLLLYEPLKIKVVFTIKSEKIGILHSVKKHISDILQNCYELQPLNRNQAREAITGPAARQDKNYYKSPPFTIDGKAVEAILTYLEKSGGEHNFYDNRGIESAMLQIICRHIEDAFASKDINQDGILSLEEMGSPEDLTKDYYENQVARLAEENSLDEKTKKRVYAFVEERLIQVQNDSKYREQVFLENLPARFKFIRDKGLADQLVNIGFLRKEKRADERVFYELSHEKLIEPILSASVQRKNNQPRTESISFTGVTGSRMEWMGRPVHDLDFSKPGEIRDVELSDPNACIRKGDELVNSRDYQKAIACYTQAITLDGTYYYSYYQRGTAHFLNGNLEQAIADFKHTLDLQPSYYVANNELGRCYLQLADTARDKGRSAEAEELYNLALSLFKKVAKANDTAYYAHNNVGLIYLRLARTDESLEWFDNALRVNPDYALSYLNRGLARSILKAYQPAIQDFDMVIDLEPDNWNAHFGKGLCFYYWAAGLSPEEKETVSSLYNDAVVSLTEAVRLNTTYELAFSTRALCYESLGNYQQASDDYSTLIYLNPKNDYAWYKRGYCAAKLENNQGAIADLTQALAIREDYVDALFERAITYVMLAQYEKAASDYDRLLALKPPDADRAYFGRGYCYYNLLNYTAAIADFNEALQLFPAYHQAWHYRGLCHYSLSDYEQAMEAFGNAVQYNPAYHQAWYYRGLCRQNLEKNEEAIADFSAAIALYPDYMDAYFERASTNYRMERYADAALDFTEVLNRKKEYHQAWYNRGLCRVALGDGEGALADFSEAISINPGYTKAFFERGLVYYKKQQFAESLADFEQIIRSNQEMEKAWYNAGLCFYQLQAFADATRAFQEVLHINPDYTDARYQLGLCFYEQQNYSEALACFLAVAAADPGYPDIHTSLGAAYYYTKQYRKAIEIFTLQIDANASNATAYSNRADAWRRLGEYEKAESDIETAFALNNEDAYVFANKALLLLQAQKDEAAFFRYLQTAVEKNYPLHKHVAEEEEFLRFKNDHRFLELVEQSKGVQAPV